MKWDRTQLTHDTSTSLSAQEQSNCRQAQAENNDDNQVNDDVRVHCPVMTNVCVALEGTNSADVNNWLADIEYKIFILCICLP